MGGIAEISGRDAGHQIARFRAHHAQNRLGGRHVGDDGKLALQVLAQPREIALQGRPRHHQKIGGFRQAGDGQVGLDPTLFVEKHRVNDPPLSHIHLRRAQAVEIGAGVAPLDPDFPERGHVKEPNPGANGHMFGLLVFEPVLPLPRILVFALLALIGEPVGTLPACHFAKDRTAGFQVVMQRRAAHAPAGFDLPIGEVVCVQETQRFSDAFFQILAVLLEGLRTADIHFPQIERGLALDDPMRQRHPCPARPGNADRVVACRHPIALHLRRFAQVVAVIGGKAFRSVKEGMDARGLEQRHAVHGVFENGHEVIPILRQRVELEILADTRHAPRFGLRLKGADHHLAGVGFVIGAFVGHAQHRQVPQPFDRFGDQVKMLAGVQRQGHARLFGQIAAPHAAAVHHHIGGDMARFAILTDIIHARDAAIGAGYARNLGVFENLCALHASTLGERHRNIGRVALAVQGQMHRTHHVAHIQMRIHRLGFRGRDFLHVDIENPRDGGLTQQFLMAVFGQRDRDRPHLPHSGFDPGFCRQLDVKVSRVFGQTRHVGRPAQLPNQPGGMPCGARGQLLTFQKDNVLPAHLGQMIGHRAARDATADDDSAGFGRDRHGEVSGGTRTSLPG